MALEKASSCLLVLKSTLRLTNTEVKWTVVYPALTVWSSSKGSIHSRKTLHSQVWKSLGFGISPTTTTIQVLHSPSKGTRCEFEVIGFFLPRSLEWHQLARTFTLVLSIVSLSTFVSSSRSGRVTSGFSSERLTSGTLLSSDKHTGHPDLYGQH